MAYGWGIVGCWTIKIARTWALGGCREAAEGEMGLGLRPVGNWTPTAAV